MTKPTQQQLNKFWEEATKWQLKDIMEYAFDKEVRDKAVSHYKWEQAEEEQLRDIMKYALNKEVRDKAIKSYKWEEATEGQLRNIMEYAFDKEVRDKAELHLPVDVYKYLIKK